MAGDYFDAQLGDRFSREYTFTPANVAQFSLAAGDDNPLHLDRSLASASRYGGLIASGTHSSALLFGLPAAHFSKITSVVARRFTAEFRRGVPADATVVIEWTIAAVAAREGKPGRVVSLEGALKDAVTGELYVRGFGEVVIGI